MKEHEKINKAICLLFLEKVPGQSLRGWNVALLHRKMTFGHKLAPSLLEFEEHLCTLLNALDEHEACWENELTRMQFTSE